MSTFLTMLLRVALLLRGRVSPRVATVAVAVTILAPALTLAGYLAMRSADLQRAQIEQDAINQTREVTAAIERDITAVENVLLTLASLASLQRGDVQAFHGRATDVSRRIGLQIVLHDTHLKQLANTAFPLGTSLEAQSPDPIIEAGNELVRTKQPVVSDVFYGPLIKQYVVAVLIPVFRGDDLAFVLAAGISTRRFADLLDNLDIRANQTVGVFDRRGVFVTRSEMHDRFTGTRATACCSAHGLSVVNAVDRNGVAFHAFSRYSNKLGWTVATGVPDAVLEAPLRQALLGFAGAGTALLVIAIGLAYFTGSRISRTIGALGIDRPPTQEEFQLLFEFAPNGVVVIDREGRIALVNALMAQMFGYARSELIGRPIEILVPDRFRDGHLHLRAVFANAPKARSMGVGMDLFGLRKDGSEFPIEVGLNPIETKAGDVVMATIVDISTRKQSQEHLARTMEERDDLHRRLLRTQENERLRLAHELHDQTGQMLTAAMLEVKNAEQFVEPSGLASFQRVRDQLEQLAASLHAIAWQLRPTSIDDVGMHAALTNHIADWSARYGISTDFQCQCELSDLDQELKTTIYRIVQEALTNVAKHALGANVVSIVLDRSDGLLRLTIEDDGCGFDLSDKAKPPRNRIGGIGVPGMRERVTLIGGEFQIESSVDIGTTIFVRVPISPKVAA